MNAFSQLIKVLLFFFGTWGSFLPTTNAEEEHLFTLVRRDHGSQAGRLLRGSTPSDDANNKIATSSSSGEYQSRPTTSSTRELATDECMVSSLADLLSAVEDTSTCPDIIASRTISISSADVDVVLDGRNKTLKPASNVKTLLEVKGDVDVEILNFNMDGADVVDAFIWKGVDVSDGANVTIGSCKITNFGYGVSIYGGVQDGGSVTVWDSSLFGNSIYGVSVSGNQRSGHIMPPIVLIQGSTINDNGKGGINSVFTNLYVERSTISKNGGCSIYAAPGLGGVDATISHSTIVPVSESQIPLLCAAGEASISVDNSILVTPSPNSTCDNFEDGKVIDGGFNAIEGSLYTSCLDGQANTTIVSDDLWLEGDLEDNGGPTMTHALLQGSPAIDAGNCSSSVDASFDQRGVARPQGSGCDIGAYEVVVVTVGVIIEPNSGGGKSCINANSQKQRITIKEQDDSTAGNVAFDATEVDEDSIVIPGYNIFTAQAKHGDLPLLIEKDNTQNVVAGSMIEVTGELLDGTVFAGTLSICK